MGGNDEQSNLVRLSIDEHAKEHQKLFEQYGKQEDFIAWKALSGQISVPEIKRLSQLVGASKGGKIGGITSGNKAVRNKTGIHSKTTEWHVAKGKKCVTDKIGIHKEGWDKAIGGRLGGAKCKEQKIGFLAEGFDKGAASRGKIYVNNGVINKKCFPNNIPENFYKGKL